MSVVQILPNGGRSPNPQPRLVEARVSSLQPAPSSFTDPLFVVEDHDPNHAIRITNWPALHGKTLPAANALVLVSFVGDQRTPRVIYWSGANTGRLLSGMGTVTWPGGSPLSNQPTITHNLGSSNQVTLGCNVTNTFVLVVLNYFTAGANSFQVQGRTADGSSPAAGTTATFSYSVTG